MILALQKTKNLFLSVALLSTFLLTTSCGDGKGGFNLEIPGVDGPHVALNEDDVVISVLFENIQIPGGLRYNVPKYNNSVIALEPDLQSDGTLMSMSIALDDVLGGNLDRLNPQTLPGGRDLPGISGGRLPAVAFTIEKFENMVFYLGPDLFGVFVPVNIKMQGTMLTSRYYSDGRRTGNITLVGEDQNGENGGFLLLLDMGRRTKKLLKKVAKRY
ncbi:MAG: hypothetical protein ISR65_01220 [Bacteriovoracaceae bacterium]|nr:hypothetical protein [Bacteriovoracaceae bacterium]